MRREHVLILLGVLIIILPFAGLPFIWLAWILPILGVLVIIIGFMDRNSRLTRESQTEQIS